MQQKLQMDICFEILNSAIYLNTFNWALDDGKCNQNVKKQLLTITFN